MKYGSITSRRCKRCGQVMVKPPDNDLCPACSKNWQIDTETKKVVPK